MNACGYWLACDECLGYENRKYPCASSLLEYLSKKGIKIDYKNTSYEYLDKLLRLEWKMKSKKDNIEFFMRIILAIFMLNSSLTNDIYGLIMSCTFYIASEIRGVKRWILK